MVPRNGAKDGCSSHENILHVRAQISTTSYSGLDVQFRFKVIAANGVAMYSASTNVLHFQSETSTSTPSVPTQAQPG